MVVTELREACRWVSENASHVHVNVEEIPLFAASLPDVPLLQAAPLGAEADRRLAAWYWLTMDAINFGSGWFPTLRKRPGRTGYSTVSSGLQARFERQGPWSAQQLQVLSPLEIALELDQDPDHELMALFAVSLNDLGAHLARDHAGDPLELIAAADHHAPALVEILSTWACFHDVSTYAGRPLPFNKRSQIAAADLARAGAARFAGLEQLTMFADNLVPHVLRLDGILAYEPELLSRIENEQLLAHGSPEEVEIRACAVQAVELIVAASRQVVGERVTAAQVDQLLWQRGQGRRYKSSPRHRSRSTAY